MVLEVKNLSKKYDNDIAVDKISFEVNKKEIFGLLGKSGAGKTTTIKILTSQVKRDDGMVSILGKSIDKWNKKDNVHLGIMTDDFGIYDRLTCLENLSLFERIYGLPIGTAQDVLKQVELYEACNKKAYELSKGMRQRLCLAKAIIHNPDLLFLDEPTSDLDPATTEKIHSIIRNLNINGTTIFITTHDMDEAYKLCDRIGIIDRGQMIACGKPEDLCYHNDERKVITIIDKKKKKHTFDNTPVNAEKIASFFAEDNVLSIKSSEPNLEEVFIKLIEENNKD